MWYRLKVDVREMLTTDSPYKVASIQYNPVLHEKDKNIEGLTTIIREAAENGAKLIVTPEMVTTGYHYSSRSTITPFVETIPGLTSTHFEQIAKEFGIYIVLGMPEVDEETDIYYNSAALIGPEGYIGKYRKTHLFEIEEHWSAWGDLGVPVFETEIGNIAINICMDSTFFESSRLAAINGADILCFPTNSSAQSISLLQSRAEINGLYVISANRSNTECGFHMIGASAIWSPDGQKLAEARFTSTPHQDSNNKAEIIYATIDPAKFHNEAKKRLSERRPTLYHDLLLYVAPWDFYKTKRSKSVQALALQYEPILGDKTANFEKIKVMLEQQIEGLEKEKRKTDIIVLPELSFIGATDSYSLLQIQEFGETMDGPSVRECQRIAKKYKSHLLFGFIELENDQLFNTVVLLNSKGEIEGTYRKVHLNQEDRRWATPGEHIKVFTSSKLGKVGIMIGSDALFPEMAGVLAVQRADIILIPSSWHGEFGNELQLNQEIPAHTYPQGSFSFLDSIALSTQAYVIMANFIGTTKRYCGRSALYTLDPLYGLDTPSIASSQVEEVLTVSFKTLQKNWWFNQEKLITMRRTHLYKPLVKKI
jgi:predicted amidohydrolase